MRLLGTFRKSLVVPALAAGLALPMSAQALVVGLDDFTITKNGFTLMGDPFNDNLAPGDPALSNATNFPPGDPAFYGLFGSSGQSETGGKRILDTTASPVFQATVDPTRTLRATGGTLITNNQPLSVSTFGLKSDDAFDVVGVFDLVEPGSVGAQYGIRIRDRVNSTNPGNDDLQMLVRKHENGNTEVVFRHFDAVSGTDLTVIENHFLTAIELATHDQIMLSLAKLNPGSNTITASYELMNNGVGSGIQTFTITNPLRDIFDGEDWTRAGFRALELEQQQTTGNQTGGSHSSGVITFQHSSSAGGVVYVPFMIQTLQINLGIPPFASQVSEPGMLALFGGGLLLLAYRARRRKA